MKKQRFTEEQIIAVLKEQEAGMKVADLCRKYGISEATFCRYRINTPHKCRLNLPQFAPPPVFRGAPRKTGGAI